MEKKQPFKALSKICLNNWHYIDKKILTFNEGINFFTGHSGSGKSTVIDAIQVVLYASGNGRGFFNKAAADDSDRTLIEYLRGMVNISENNESQYLRNQNFSSTIVLEFMQTNTHEKQCVGVVFDVETATNNVVKRLFFWHMGGLLDNHYRADKRCLTTGEVREYLQRNFPKERFYCGPSDERFRSNLYDTYLGGLDKEKFPRLFKRAIPFRMNIKLEDFVKEYICMEQDIHIEDLQESVMQYGRMRGRIEETMEEIRRLLDIKEAYTLFHESQNEVNGCEYQIHKLRIKYLEAKEQEYRDKAAEREAEIHLLEKALEQLNKDAANIQKEYDEIIIRIANSGYEGMEQEVRALNETLERLNISKAKWTKTADNLKLWKNQGEASNQILWDVEKFVSGTISEQELEYLKNSFKELREELEDERRDIDSSVRKIKKEESTAREELKKLKQGKKAYPVEVEEARYELRNRLHEKCGKFVNVQILADLLDVRDERWHKAVEGYMGNNKLLLIVEPAYAKLAMSIYQEMDKERFCKAAVLDTEKVMEQTFVSKENSLAKEVIAKESHVRAYIDFFLGNVQKCESIEELRECKIGITADCMLYHSFRLQHINPDNYTRRAYIGETSMRQRINQLESRLQKLNDERMPLQAQLAQIEKILQMEMISLPTADYMSWLSDMEQIPGKERRKKQLLEKMKTLKEESVEAWEKQRDGLILALAEKRSKIQEQDRKIWNCQKDADELKDKIVEKVQFILEEQSKFEEFKKNFALEKLKGFEQAFEEYLARKRSENYENFINDRNKDKEELKKKAEEKYQQLVDIRSAYIRNYPNRTFSISIKDNEPYEKLLDNLQCDNLEQYKEAAKEQARAAAEHFREDFVYKIRAAIREAYQRKDELNRIISKLDFGKDKYQFVITKNKGADGKYYKMFMDDSLQINPFKLNNTMENQMNLFTMEHEEQYGDMMNELINIFIPPENATKEELDEAKKNMDKYADYRTYLSFDMQQIVRGEKDMTIGLSKMIKKNSGGEGQNPLYVALLASFAQLYRINFPTKIKRNPTIRLVILDEAFSKMDAEKVASCISLIRGLGFQAIISATNDKIQNYLENVDKTFVYANPNKKHISIQEFEKMEFELLEDKDEE